MSLEPASVRVHPRARRIVLRLSADGGLHVSLPRACPRSRLEQVIEEKAPWILRTRARLAAEAALRGRASGLPEEVRFPAFGEVWSVQALPGGRIQARESGGVVRLHGADPVAPAAGLAALKRWVLRRAQPLLQAALDQASRESGLAHRGLRCAWARSRWGSCSPSGSIRLSARLAFLEADLLRLVLLHELCHLRHRGHGPAFWALLSSLEPRARELSRRLARAGAQVPAWLDPHPPNPEGP